MAETMILSAEARHSFYPTPPVIADRMLEGIRLGGMERILEPSAGTGNLAARLWIVLYYLNNDVVVLFFSLGDDVIFRRKFFDWGVAPVFCDHTSFGFNS